MGLILTPKLLATLLQFSGPVSVEEVEVLPLVVVVVVVVVVMLLLTDIPKPHHRPFHSYPPKHRQASIPSVMPILFEMLSQFRMQTPFRKLKPPWQTQLFAVSKAGPEL